MAQLSTDTLIYSQIVARVQQFIEEYIIQKSVSPKTFDEGYQKTLADIQKTIGGLSFDVNLISKGDIPNSEIFNKVITAMAKDLNILTNQLEAMSASYINTFNLFSNQIEAEKNSISRIRSKINVLEMYSQSPSVNVMYFGDTFNNLSFVDAKKIRAGLVPDVSDGYVTLAKNTSKTLKTTAKVINQNYNQSISNQVSFADASNGLRGNHFLFYKDQNNAQFLYEKDSSILRSNESAITDGSPATYFEYEAISVLASQFTGRPQYEFQYLDGDKFVNWANFDINNPLKLTLEFSARNQSGESINYISIIPFFGYDIEGTNSIIKNVKVTSIKLFNQQSNTTYELINSGPVYIASDPAKKTLDNYNNFFYNKGVFRFDQRKVNKVYITFEQDEFKDTVIRHAYWTPYELGKTTKWNNQNRFEPESAINAGVQNISWDKSLLVPSINDPTKFKSDASDVRQISVNYTNQVSVGDKYQVKITSGQQSYYWYKKDTELNIDYFTTKQDSVSYSDRQLVDLVRQRLIATDYPSACVFVDSSKADSVLNSRIKLSTISTADGTATITTIGNHGLINGDKVYIRDRWSTVDILGNFSVISVDSPTQFKVSISNTGTLPATDISQNFGLCVKVIDVATDVNTVVETTKETIDKTEKVQINLQRNFEELKAKRASIGIRDVSFGQETYQESAEIISKPFFVSGNLEMLSIQAVDIVPQGQPGQSYIKYSISVDGGTTYFPIQPIERNYTGTPEILVFNQNLTDSTTLPQVMYLNNGKDNGVPNPINSVIVKIEMKKDRSSNNTPILYYYKVGARFR